MVAALHDLEVVTRSLTAHPAGRRIVAVIVFSWHDPGATRTLLRRVVLEHGPRYGLERD